MVDAPDPIYSCPPPGPATITPEVRWLTHPPTTTNVITAHKLLSMTLHLVRHAMASSRSAWTGNDFRRPLDPVGLAQADAIAVELSTRPVERVLSSPALRCTSTVEPLARTLGLEVKTEDELGEGTLTRTALNLITSLAERDGDSVLCSHGDIIPGVIWTLARKGLNLPDRHRCKKASIWELTVTNGRISAGTYRHPKTFGAAPY